MVLIGYIKDDITKRRKSHFRETVKFNYIGRKTREFWEQNNLILLFRMLTNFRKKKPFRLP